MPRLWDATIDDHRRSVHAAILDATAALVAEHGLTGVTMSQIAQAAGIGRATLYKYFPDVEAIVVAWHERQVTDHLQHLTAAAARATRPGQRLQVLLSTYARLSSGGQDHDHAAALHGAAHVRHAHAHLHTLVADAIDAAAGAGEVRTDVPAAELAAFCLHALAAASTMPSQAARDRLVAVTLTALQAPGT
ncbi:TetR/AcrR family transcriptional regulator [Dactylosporangium sp. NPDC005555]|uniref:TetR/AcrR family transcriptional regulator n=1 Tax=Dactylosporangium sp. NPDC005555 TaxID=3154889 RepID=UPI0033B75B6B